MIHSPQVVKGLVIYVSIILVAVVLGYVLATPLSYSTLAIIAGVVMVLVVPLVLRWHHPLLLLSWNMTAVVPFVPGRPQLWMLLALVSITISVLQYALTRKVAFINVPSMLRPILFIGVTVFFTAALTGGIGMRIFGSESIGGRKYLAIYLAIMGYFAITAHRIPPARANLFVGLFLLGAVTNAVGNALPYVPEFLYPIFPVSIMIDAA